MGGIRLHLRLLCASWDYGPVLCLLPLDKLTPSGAILSWPLHVCHDLSADLNLDWE